MWMTRSARAATRAYELTRARRKQLGHESKDWEQIVAVMQRLLAPAESE